MSLLQQPNKNDIALLTKSKVMQSFENVPCYLYAVISLVEDNEKEKFRKYKVATFLATYRDEEVLQFNEDSSIIYDENGLPLKDVMERLTVLELKQSWSPQIVTYAQISEYSKLITQEIPDKISDAEIDNYKMQLIFLMERQKDAPWGVPGEEWRVAKEYDLLRSKAI